MTPPTIDTVASLALTAMSTIVAIAACVFSFRQNVGWKPVVLVVDESYSCTPAATSQCIDLALEIWNRRKYPIAVRGLKVSVSGLKLRDRPAKTGPYLQGNTFYLNAGELVAPDSHLKIPLNGTLDAVCMEAMCPLYEIEVYYFDPHRNRRGRLKLKHRFFHPMVGWKRTLAERERAIASWKQLNEEFGAPPARGDSELPIIPS